MRVRVIQCIRRQTWMTLGMAMFVIWMLAGCGAGVNEKSKSPISEPLHLAAEGRSFSPERSVAATPAPSNADPSLEGSNSIPSESSEPIESLESPESPEAAELPSELVLTYHELELEPLPEGKPDKAWEQAGAVSFGSIEGHAAELQFFYAADPLEKTIRDVYGFLEVNGIRYAAGMLLPHADEGATIDGRSEYALEVKVPGLNRIEIVGAVPLMSAGGGLYRYVVYDDTAPDSLLFFDAWGMLKLADWNGDGVDEMLLQFEGYGNNPANVSVIRVTNGSLQLSEPLTESMPFRQFNIAFLMESDEGVAVRIQNETFEADYVLAEDGRSAHRISGKSIINR